MPSSSSPSLQSTHQAPAMSEQKQEGYGYRQTTYHNGRGVQIEESRRRSWALRKVEPPVQTYTDFVLYPLDNNHTYPRSSLRQVEQSHPALRGRATGLGERHVTHVTSAKHVSKGKSKPVVIHGSAKSNRELPVESKGVSNSSAGPTPPPTPRLGRLPTPELDDLDEAPFCDCGVESHVIKRCTECGLEVDPWSA
ncbi:hypothetical protein BKA58DRAFT_169854 [Alternaria rosae]|uniref:uncharacterized protein n=1 Tax=Alternaria rosae TaxID=1187941 RepID=UPI001E8D6DF5|nr:uncharacterized protein BKA58DRAFT_169854 [Alternaria rosae]KAH6870030.1 hypothetical protein BKA58DRAFT_169854 [Alternaria rosae]